MCGERIADAQNSSLRSYSMQNKPQWDVNKVQWQYWILTEQDLGKEIRFCIVNRFGLFWLTATLYMSWYILKCHERSWERSQYGPHTSNTSRYEYSVISALGAWQASNTLLNLSKTPHRNILCALDQPVELPHDSCSEPWNHWYPSSDGNRSMSRRGTRSGWGSNSIVFLGNTLLNLAKTPHRNILCALDQPVELSHDSTLKSLISFIRVTAIDLCPGESNSIVFLGNTLLNLSKTPHRNILCALDQPVELSHDSCSDFQQNPPWNSISVSGRISISVREVPGVDGDPIS